MNLISKLKDIYNLNKEYNDIYTQVNKTKSMKALLTSKRFWLSIVVMLGTLATIVPPKISVYVIGIGAIITKIIDIINTPMIPPSVN